jgi:hypothetical protein
MRHLFRAGSATKILRGKIIFVERASGFVLLRAEPSGNAPVDKKKQYKPAAKAG